MIKALPNNAVAQLLKQKLRWIDLEQGSAEWFKMRKTKRTASETPIVLGLSPWSSASQLALEKFSSKVTMTDNVATRHGHKYEPIARATFEQLFDCSMPAAVCIRGDYMASLDGINASGRSILEIKCPYMQHMSDTWVRAADDEIPDHYVAQIQHQLMVSGADRCEFWVFDSKRKRGIRIVVEPDKNYFARILIAWEAWMKKYL